MTEENGTQQATTLGDNVMGLAALLVQMKKMGVPYTTGLDILRIALMFAESSGQEEKAAAAMRPNEMKEPVQ